MWSVWKRKNVALTGYGAMARLDMTHGDGVTCIREEGEWLGKLFEMVVWGHNSSHRFSQFPPQIFICAPEEMTRVRRRDLYN